MGDTTITNLSTLTDYAAVARVGIYMAGREYEALHDACDIRIINITQGKQSHFTVTESDR